MPTAGWQVTLSAHLQHYAHVFGQWAKTVPGWTTGLAVLAALAALAWKALRQAAEPPDEPQRLPASRVSEPPSTRLKEEPQ